jgi:quinol monooxygenase YgiN
VADAFVYINRFKIKDGRLDDYRTFCRKVVSAAEREEPNMVEFGMFLDTKTNEVTVLQVHTHVENMAHHMNTISEFMDESRDLIDFSEMSATILGTPTEAILEQMAQLAGAGMSVSINTPIAFFDRF